MIERARCPICETPAPVIFSRPYVDGGSLLEGIPSTGLRSALAGKSYEVRGCAACDFHFQTWVMEGTELASYYSVDPAEASIESEIAAQKLHWFAHQTEEVLVLRQLCKDRRPVVLDFGCNWGKWASMALAHGCVVDAVEVNAIAARFCQRRGIRMRSERELEAGRYDFINLDQVLEHLSDPVSVGRRLAAALRFGGWVKVSTPENRQLPSLLRRMQTSNQSVVPDAATLDAMAPLMHVNLFTAQALKRWATRCGLGEFRLPFWKMVGAGQLWNVPRQFNHNCYAPWKRWRGRGTYQWFVRPAASRPIPNSERTPA